MAGVKLCTGRTITNHPHFEDKGLRDRTQEVNTYLRHFKKKIRILKTHTFIFLFLVIYFFMNGNYCSLTI